MAQGKFRRGRRSPRERQEAINATFRFYGTPQFQTELPPKRVYAKPGSNGRPLERNVLPKVISALRADPRVARVDRNTSGLLQDGDRIIRVGTKGKLDLTVFLKNGRWGEIEVKRDQHEKPEEHQYQRIEHINRDGGFAGWCWDVPSALAVLPC